METNLVPIDNAQQENESSKSDSENSEKDIIEVDAQRKIEEEDEKID